LDASRCAAGGNWKNFKLGIDFLTVVRYSIENKEKPMRKRSKPSSDITESCRRWDCSMGTFEEWTFEAGPEPTVGAGGIRTRYPTGAYDSM